MRKTNASSVVPQIGPCMLLPRWECPSTHVHIYTLSRQLAERPIPGGAQMSCSVLAAGLPCAIALVRC